MKELDNLRKAVGLPPRPIHMNMDPWTYGRISGPLEELVKHWREVAKKWMPVKGFKRVAPLFGCANELEDVLKKWEGEADEVSDEMYADHMREQAELGVSHAG